MEAHSHDVRLKAIDLWKEGQKKAKISRELGVDYDTLLGWIKRYSQEGDHGLCVRYERCGRKTGEKMSAVQSRAIELVGEHQEWGAGYVRLKLLEEFPGVPIAQPRQIQRWIAKSGVRPKGTKLPPVQVDWASKPLDRVQVDAKERLKTKDGKECCYLNFIDEHTGAELDAFVFPLREDQPSCPQGNL
jgi:transposase